MQYQNTRNIIYSELQGTLLWSEELITVVITKVIITVRIIVFILREPKAPWVKGASFTRGRNVVRSVHGERDFQMGRACFATLWSLVVFIIVSVFLWLRDRMPEKCMVKMYTLND